MSGRSTQEAGRLPPAQAGAQVTSSDQLSHTPSNKLWASNCQPGRWVVTQWLSAIQTMQVPGSYSSKHWVL